MHAPPPPSTGLPVCFVFVFAGVLRCCCCCCCSTLLRQNLNPCDETVSMYECVWKTENAYSLRGSRVETKENKCVGLPVKPAPRKEDVSIKQSGHLHAKNACATGSGSASSRTRMTDNLNSIMISLDYLVAASDTWTPAFTTPCANTKGKKKKFESPQIQWDIHALES